MNHNLNFNIKFDDLYNNKALKTLDTKFLTYLKAKNTDAYKFLLLERSIYKEFSKQYSNNPLLITCAKILEDFIVELFTIQTAYIQMQHEIQKQQNLLIFHKQFVNKYVKKFVVKELEQYNFNKIKTELFRLLKLNSYEPDKIVSAVLFALKKPKQNEYLIQIATIFGAFIINDNNALAQYPEQFLFFKAKKTNFAELVPNEKNGNSITKSNNDSFINRNNFNLYNDIDNSNAQHQSNYCVKCHLRSKDHCCHGSLDTQNTYKKNPLGQNLEGCPLSMHISEMHLLNSEKYLLAALAVAMINNPLLAGTGDNICTDCKASCIFQKQETVNTPKVESYILKQVLSLPYGFEIYSLLTRWNPLRHYRPFPKYNTNYKVLVVGLGPAGYTLAYNLALEGHDVVAIDAMKIEPLKDLQEIKPIINIKDIWEELDNRTIYGFGGVAEYGITSRWDKNYLKIIAIILARQEKISIMGNTRFGSVINFQNAKALGFHHVALCTGAGKPNILNIKNSMIAGVKTSSEFLMNLHLGAFQLNNLLNLQIELPFVVIGGGLTAVDCATEAYVYYQRLLQKIYNNYSLLKKQNKAENFIKSLSTSDKKLLNTYLEHYDIVQLAKQKDGTAMFALQKLGGVKIVYHRAFNQSSAYRNNYQDLHQCLKQGVEFIENSKLLQINVNSTKQLQNITLKNITSKQQTILPTKTLIFALGTHPNDVTINEQKLSAKLSQEDEYTQSYKKQKFSTYLQDNQFIDITLMGDTHHLFNGSVVKAMASSYYSQYIINKLLAKQQPTLLNFNRFKSGLLNKVHLQINKIKSITPKLLEITIDNEFLASEYKAGQFFKIQNYQGTNNSKAELSEPVFLTGLVLDDPKLKNQIKLLLQAVGSSSSILANNPKNIVINGPLGEPTPILQNKNILLVAGGVANAVSISILEKAYQHNKVHYIGGFQSIEDIFYLQHIEQHSLSHIITLEKDTNNTEDSKYIKGNIIDGLKFFINKHPNEKIDEIFVAGSCTMMSRVKDFLQNNEYFKYTNTTASLNSIMLCGTKGVCATCVQQVGNSFIYACANQEQAMKDVSFSFLENKLKQHSLQEKLSYALKNNENK